MTRKVGYSDEPLGKLRVIPDFLPPPEDFVRRKEGGKVKKSVSRRSVEVIKRKSRRRNDE